MAPKKRSKASAPSQGPTEIPRRPRIEENVVAACIQHKFKLDTATLIMQRMRDTKNKLNKALLYRSIITAILQALGIESKGPILELREKALIGESTLSVINIVANEDGILTWYHRKVSGPNFAPLPYHEEEYVGPFSSRTSTSMATGTSSAQHVNKGKNKVSNFQIQYPPLPTPHDTHTLLLDILNMVYKMSKTVRTLVRTQRKDIGEDTKDMDDQSKDFYDTYRTWYPDYQRDGDNDDGASSAPMA